VEAGSNTSIIALRVVRVDEKEPYAWGYNLCTPFLGDINTGNMKKGEWRKEGWRGMKIMKKLGERKNSKENRRKTRRVMEERRRHLPDVSCLRGLWFV
jgi:hypothetical protein